MKKNYSFLPVILLTIVIGFSSTSCSKQKDQLLPPANESSKISDVQNRLFGYSGSITGMILPLRTKVKMAVYNSTFSSSYFYYSSDGSFRFDRIPSGIYSLFIFDLTTSQPHIISNIKVKAGNITNIGEIRLD